MTPVDTKRSRLCTLYSVQVRDIDVLLAEFLLSHCLARDMLRIGVDPMTHTIARTGMLFTVSTFRRIISTTNQMVPGKPSIHSALFSSDPTRTLHAHNLLISDDSAFQSTRKLVEKWLSGETCAYFTKKTTVRR